MSAENSSATSSPPALPALWLSASAAISTGETPSSCRSEHEQKRYGSSTSLNGEGPTGHREVNVLSSLRNGTRRGGTHVRSPDGPLTMTSTTGAGTIGSWHGKEHVSSLSKSTLDEGRRTRPSVFLPSPA